jgi:hypothetical protein
MHRVGLAAIDGHATMASACGPTGRRYVGLIADRNAPARFFPSKSFSPTDVIPEEYNYNSSPLLSFRVVPICILDTVFTITMCSLPWQVDVTGKTSSGRRLRGRRS